ncbi:hypothetical protein O6H91_06G067800 [Diphasiastrum complanatum]|uniref:Uncharacterized protein n=1 Tax=Diphasiastrum complanatum TaxID=34168 RepID=A0ACC2DEI2_DIPCM|nr:hypothetical protein O6H91_06G067800 [Diphasiastrum complanatum]
MRTGHEGNSRIWRVGNRTCVSFTISTSVLKFKMSEDPFICQKHLWHLDGVCASCLREKLDVLTSSRGTTSHGIKLGIRSMRLQLNESREEKLSLPVSEDDLLHLECIEKNASLKRSDKRCSERDTISENSDDTFKESLNHSFSSAIHLEDPNLIDRVHSSQTAPRETKTTDNAHSKTSCINVFFRGGFINPENSSKDTPSRSVEEDATYRSTCCHTFHELSDQNLDERSPSRTVINVDSEHSRDWNSELRQWNSSEDHVNQRTSPNRKRHLRNITWSNLLATFLNFFGYKPPRNTKCDSKDEQSFSNKPGTCLSPSACVEAELKHGSEAPACVAFSRDCATSSLKKSCVPPTTCKDSERGNRDALRSRHFANAGGYWKFSLSPWRPRLKDAKQKF